MKEGNTARFGHLAAHLIENSISRVLRVYKTSSE